ncbi:MAG: hypothetical protein WCE75_05685 [Terracidiphilus sp.]
MTNQLAFAEFLFAWQWATYGAGQLSTRDEAPERPALAALLRESWVRGLTIRCLIAAAVLVLALKSSAVAFWLSLLLLGAGLLAALTRRSLVRVANLAEYELTLNALTVFLAWRISLSLPEAVAILPVPGLSEVRLTVLCTSAAILVFATRGGSLVVRGVLEKAAGLPQGTGKTGSALRHGEMIGQVERIVVILVWMAGSPQALAFFFAAKGLIRSKELEERALADYFLLGSLVSFLIALVSGLLLTKLVLPLWG